MAFLSILKCRQNESIQLYFDYIFIIQKLYIFNHAVEKTTNFYFRNVERVLKNFKIRINSAIFIHIFVLGIYWTAFCASPRGREFLLVEHVQRITDLP